MNTHQHHEERSGDHRKTPFWCTPAGTVLAVFLAVAGLLLIFEHRAHILGDWVLFLPLLICIGMHFFMHGSHGHGNHDRHKGSDDAR